MSSYDESQNDVDVTRCDSAVAFQVSDKCNQQTEPPRDHLLLCVAHHPSVTPALMSSLITVTASKCREITSKMIKASVAPGSTQRLLLTGSTYMPRPGKDLPDWESSWTLGDQVMARLVGEIGLEFFACGSNQKVRLMTHLLDMEWTKGQENIQDDGNGVSPSRLENKEDEDREKIQKQQESNVMQQKDVIKVCSRVQHWLKLRDATEHLVQATVLVPCIDEESEDDVKSLVESVFAEMWSDGPLQNVQVLVELVTVESA